MQNNNQSFNMNNNVKQFLNNFEKNIFSQIDDLKTKNQTDFNILKTFISNIDKKIEQIEKNLNDKIQSNNSNNLHKIELYPKELLKFS